MACQGHFSHHPLDFNIESWTSYHTSEVARMLPPLWIQCNITSIFWIFSGKKDYTPPTCPSPSTAAPSAKTNSIKFPSVDLPITQLPQTYLRTMDGDSHEKLLKGWNRPGRDLFENSHTTQENKRANEVWTKFLIKIANNVQLLNRLLPAMCKESRWVSNVRSRRGSSSKRALQSDTSVGLPPQKLDASSECGYHAVANTQSWCMKTTKEKQYHITSRHT